MKSLITFDRPKQKGIAAIVLMFLVAVFAVVPAAVAQAQHSNISTTTINMTVGESITIIPPQQTVTLNYTAGATSTPPTTFQVTSLWQLANTHTAIHMNWWLQSATAALSAGGSSNIPASQVFSNVNGGAYSGCAAAADPLVPSAVAGSTCNVGLVIPLTSANYAGQETDTIGLELQNLSTALASGTYTGQLSIQMGTN